MKRPTNAQLMIATMWLDGNEGDAEEQGSCQAVARWLDWHQQQAELRSVAREAGVSVVALRRRLAGSVPQPDEEEN